MTGKGVGGEERERKQGRGKYERLTSKGRGWEGGMGKVGRERREEREGRKKEGGKSLLIKMVSAPLSVRQVRF